MPMKEFSSMITAFTVTVKALDKPRNVLNTGYQLLSFLPDE
jgi:hypothetical protein